MTRSLSAGPRTDQVVHGSSWPLQLCRRRQRLNARVECSHHGDSWIRPHRIPGSGQGWHCVTVDLFAAPCWIRRGRRRDRRRPYGYRDGGKVPFNLTLRTALPATSHGPRNSCDSSGGGNPSSWHAARPGPEIGSSCPLRRGSAPPERWRSQSVGPGRGDQCPSRRSLARRPRRETHRVRVDDLANRLQL